jgi:hypothetical protein
MPIQFQGLNPVNLGLPNIPTTQTNLSPIPYPIGPESISNPFGSAVRGLNEGLNLGWNIYDKLINMPNVKKQHELFGKELEAANKLLAKAQAGGYDPAMKALSLGEGGAPSFNLGNIPDPELLGLQKRTGQQSLDVTAADIALKEREATRQDVLAGYGTTPGFKKQVEGEINAIPQQPLSPAAAAAARAAGVNPVGGGTPAPQVPRALPAGGGGTPATTGGGNVGAVTPPPPVDSGIDPNNTASGPFTPGDVARWYDLNKAGTSDPKKSIVDHAVWNGDGSYGVVLKTGKSVPITVDRIVREPGNWAPTPKPTDPNAGANYNVPGPTPVTAQPGIVTPSDAAVPPVAAAPGVPPTQGAPVPNAMTNRVAAATGRAPLQEVSSNPLPPTRADGSPWNQPTAMQRASTMMNADSETGLPKEPFIGADGKQVTYKTGMKAWVDPTDSSGGTPFIIMPTGDPKGSQQRWYAGRDKPGDPIVNPKADMKLDMIKEATKNHLTLQTADGKVLTPDEMNIPQLGQVLANHHNSTLPPGKFQGKDADDLINMGIAIDNGAKLMESLRKLGSANKISGISKAWNELADTPVGTILSMKMDPDYKDFVVNYKQFTQDLKQAWGDRRVNDAEYKSIMNFIGDPSQHPQSFPTYLNKSLDTLQQKYVLAVGNMMQANTQLPQDVLNRMTAYHKNLWSEGQASEQQTQKSGKQLENAAPADQSNVPAAPSPNAVTPNPLAPVNQSATNQPAPGAASNALASQPGIPANWPRNSGGFPIITKRSQLKNFPRGTHFVDSEGVPSTY